MSVSVGISQISPDFVGGGITPFRREVRACCYDSPQAGVLDFRYECFQMGIPGQQPAKQHAQGKDVGAAIGLRIAVLLGRREIHSAEAYRVLPRALVIHAGDAEVDQRNFSLRVHYDILWLDIPVDHGRRLTVQIGEYVAKLKDDGDDLFLRQLVFGGVSVKRRSLDILAHNTQHPVVLVFGGEPGKAGMTEFFQKHSLCSTGNQPFVGVALGQEMAARSPVLDPQRFARGAVRDALHRFIISEELLGVTVIVIPI